LNPPTNNDAQKGAILLTIFLRHDQSKTLDEINAQLRKQGYYKAFPPAGIEVVSWYVVMGIGQVITVRVPPERLRDVNLRSRRPHEAAIVPNFIRPMTTNLSAKPNTLRPIERREVTEDWEIGRWALYRFAVKNVRTAPILY
jgi:hypothetical protein